MRLAKLKIRNIASLKGEHEIDFLEIQRESSLFAITGETGSGKSSILNSIGLALYGQIYKKNVNQIDVVTLGEKEGSIELIFQVKGKYFLADWRARVRKQNGEPYSTPQTPVRNLYEIESPDFNASKNISDKTVTELLNLDFDQYCKCIILNQGEFAKFLTSSFTDRKEILEKLYPGEMLESMSRELKLELDSLQKTKEALDIELQTLTGDGPSGDNLKEQKEAFEKELKVTETLAQQIEKIDSHFVSLIFNHDKFAENEKKIETIKKEMADHTSRFNLLLKKGQELSELKDLAVKERDSKLPGLQLLLKKEEGLKHQESQLKLTDAKKTDLLKTLERSEIEIKKVKISLEESEAKLASAKTQVTLPLESLKSSRELFNETFDLFGQKEIAEEEVKGKSARLKELETQGKDLKAELQAIEEKLIKDPAALKTQEKEIETQKKTLQEEREKSQRAEIKSQEIKKNIELLLSEDEIFTRREVALKELIQKSETELAPLETTLKLQEVITASEICVTHALDKKSDECPVCHQGVTQAAWGELKKNLAKTDLGVIKTRAQELSLLLVQSAQEEKFIKEKKSKLELDKQEREKELKELTPLLNVKLPSFEELDKKLEDLKKLIWENDSKLKDSQRVTSELNKTREAYVTLNKEIKNKEETLNESNQRLITLGEKLKSLVPVLNKDSIQLLKKESRSLQHYLETEGALAQISQQMKHLTEQKSQKEDELKSLSKEITTLIEATELLKKELHQELKGAHASDLINELNLKAKNALDQWALHEKEQSEQDSLIKNCRARLNELDNLTKDYDLGFTKELHAVREGAKVSAVQRPETQILLERLQKLSLELKSTKELFIPLQDYLRLEREFYKNTVNELRTKFGSAKSRLEDWEKLQDKILITKMKSQDITEKFDRRSRLFEVLGKDELRTFVLSLVEENLIEQTNQELQKLCQGRYEILHQSRKMKMTPEFFILDKFREGGLRKVSTLSGGETFMVSLAMALGLAEMTRGQAEIDSLFIDEGFGTLDQESLEDVLDMLQQIQTRGLMVGIISHIKALTSAIPVNLVLNKSQDGTSSVSIRHN